MSEKKKPKERTFVSAGDGKAKKSAPDKPSAAKVAPQSQIPKSKATGFRIAAILMWLVAIAFEIFTITVLNGTLYLPGNSLTWVVVGIILDLVFVVGGSLAWKHANRIAPASEKDKVKFWLWNNLGVIAAVLAFLPLIVLLLRNDQLDGKTKKIVTIVAAIALVLAAGLSYDFNPVSQEDLAAANEAAFLESEGVVYWTPWGKVYHLDPDCRAIKNSDNIYYGTPAEAFEAHRTRPCSFCATSVEEIKDDILDSGGVDLDDDLDDDLDHEGDDE